MQVLEESSTPQVSRLKSRSATVAVLLACVLAVAGVYLVMRDREPRQGGDQPLPSRFHASGQVIEESPAKGPMLAVAGLLTSLPPGGGDVTLGGWSWALVDDRRELMGVSWTEGTWDVTGSWDGHVLTVDKVKRSSRASTADVEIRSECSVALSPQFEQQHWAELNIRFISYVEGSGGCIAEVEAVGPSGDLSAALAQTDSVEVRYLLEPA